MGLVFIYPHSINTKKPIQIEFHHSFEKVEYNIKYFMQQLTSYIDMIEGNNPPPIPEECKNINNRKHCVMHNFFYDINKLNKLTKNA